MTTLEHILWEELGSKSDYEKEYGTTPVSKLVRKIVGLDLNPANEAFGKFLNNESLNVSQIRFVKQIADYVVANGLIEDNSVLMEQPFSTVGSIVTLFKDQMDQAREIMNVIDRIRKNAEEIA